MVNGFPQLPLGKIVADVIDNRGRTPPWDENESIELIETASIVGDNKYPDYSLVQKRVSQETYDHWFRGHPRAKDILIATVGANIGNLSIMKESRGCVAQNLVCLRVDMKQADPDFVYYFLTWEATQVSLKNLDIGAAQPSIKVPHLLNTKISIPPLPEQRAIADILGVLDDKIELNRRMNATLESMARAVFRQWFVDNEEINNWEIGKLGNLCQSTIGGDWGEDKEFEGSIPVICLRGVDLDNLRKDGYSEDAPIRWIKKSSLEKRELTDRDILIAGSGIGPVGKPLWVSPEILHVYSYPVIYSNFVKRFRAKSLGYAVYVDRVLFNMRESNEIWDYINGTSIPNLNDSDLLAFYQISIPPEKLVNEFYDYIKPIYTKLYSKESRTLASLRDALLPKLMRGEVRVKGVEVS